MANILASGHYHGYRTVVVADGRGVMGPRLVDLVGTSGNAEISDAVASVRLISDSELVPWSQISDDPDGDGCDECADYDDGYDCNDQEDCDDYEEYDGCADYSDPSECPGCVDCA